MTAEFSQINSASGHTPGSWGMVRVGSKPTRIQAVSWEGTKPTFTTIAEVIDPVNVPVIMHAPELLAALRDIANAYQEGDYGRIRRVTAAAIAKAEGRDV